MSTLVQLKPHLNLRQIKYRYRKCQDVMERSHWQVIWLRAKGMPTKDVAEVTGFKVDWIRRLVRRYNANGPESLGDQRRNNRGQEPILDAKGQAALHEALKGPAPDGGLWSGPKVAQWITDRTGVELSNKGGWLYLKKLGMTLQLPRPKHPQAASAEEQEAFKKNSATNSSEFGPNILVRPSSFGRKTKRALA